MTALEWLALILGIGVLWITGNYLVARFSDHELQAARRLREEREDEAWAQRHIEDHEGNMP